MAEVAGFILFIGLMVVIPYPLSGGILLGVGVVILCVDRIAQAVENKNNESHNRHMEQPNE